MERKVNFRDRQEQQADDHNNLQTFVGETFEDLITDAIHDGKAFAGFATVASGQTEITTQRGQLYTAGAVHIRRDVWVRDLFEYLPVATKRVVTLCTWASESDLDAEPRDFLINVDTGATEPKSVAMTKVRVANLGTQPGIESPHPQPPVLSDTLLAVAHITLTTSGIESIVMVAANKLPRLKETRRDVDSLVAWRDLTEPRITTIASDVAGLAVATTHTASVRDMMNLYTDVARLKELHNIPDDYSDYGADRYLTADETDTDNVNLLAKVEEGVRFGPANAGLSELAVFSTLNPNMKITSGLLLPSHSHVRRLSIQGYSGETSISQYGYQTYALEHHTMSRQRIRYGTEFLVCTNERWWRSGTYDPARNIFTVNGETFELLNGVPDIYGGQTHIVRARQFWVDSYNEEYWDLVTVPHSIQGAQVAQTFLNSQDGWLTKIGFFLTRRAGSGNVHVSLCETVAGAPDLSKTIMHMTVDYADLKLYPTQTTIPVPPTFLRAGKRYAVVLTTNADHWVAMASGDSYSQGTFFYSTDGAFYAGDLTRDMMLDLHFARFDYPRVVIDMQPLQLDGGIAAIDIIAPMIVPHACQATFEVQVNSAWIPLSAVNTLALIGLPPLIPLRIVFNGTTDVAPGVMMPGSQVQVSRPRTTFRHISTPRLLAAASGQIKIELLLEYFNPTNHTIACKLYTGGAYATEETPDVTETEIRSGSQTIKRYTFNVSPDITQFKIDLAGTTTSALDVFHVSERVDVAF